MCPPGITPSLGGRAPRGELGPLENTAQALPASKAPECHKGEALTQEIPFLPALSLIRSRDAQLEIQVRDKRELKMSKPVEAGFLVTFHITNILPALLQSEVTDAQDGPEPSRLPRHTHTHPRAAPPPPAASVPKCLSNK